MDKTHIVTWNSDHKIFETLINEVKPKVIIEIGSWHGGSAIRMAELAPEATIYCIDTWLGASEFYTLGGQERDLELVDGYPSVYKTFRKNTKKYKNIIPIPLPSHEARHIVPDADLIYIDGSHDFDAVTQDLKDYYPKGKVLFGDDYGNTVFEVKEAVDTFMMGKEPIEVVDNWFWVVRK
jgi:cephalosporin hydroxylase